LNVAGKYQSSDFGRAYLEAVYRAFESHIDFAQLVKIYGAATGESNTERKYSSSECTGIRKDVISGDPDKKYISTSFVER
jgi:hypothetical protein